MKPIALASLVAAAVLLPLAARAEDPVVVASPSAVQWKPAPANSGLPKGSEIAMLFGDPTKAEPYAYRLKLPAGGKIMAHTHPNDENVTVLSGSLHVGLGDKLDPAKGTVIGAGGFIHVPKGTPHYAWATGPTVLQANSVGPSGRMFMNPADDPMKAK